MSGWQHKHSSGPRWRKRDSHCAACRRAFAGKRAGERRGTSFLCRECAAHLTFDADLGVVIDRATGRPMAEVKAR